MLLIIEKYVNTIVNETKYFVHQLQAARVVGAYHHKFKALLKLLLLIIDDFGLKPLKPG